VSEPTRDEARARARAIANEFLARGDAIGWFEAFYRDAGGVDARVPWADLQGHPLLVGWLDRQRVRGGGRRALVVGGGLGEDSEALASAGFEATGFDVSPTAIEWCRKRFPQSRVDYRAADLFRAPSEWRKAFDLVLELYTLQALPQELRLDAARGIADFVAPQGELLVITRGREPEEPLAELPWPLVKSELAAFETLGLRESRFEDLGDGGSSDRPGRHFRVHYRAPVDGSAAKR
jgi:hypothetical protein